MPVGITQINIVGVAMPMTAGPVLQALAEPKVAASATLGKDVLKSFNRKAVAPAFSVI